MTKESFLKTLNFNNIIEQEVIDLMKNINMKAEDKWNMLNDLGLNAEEIFDYYVENHLHDDDNNIWEVK